MKIAYINSEKGTNELIIACYDDRFCRFCLLFLLFKFNVLVSQFAFQDSQSKGQFNFSLRFKQRSTIYCQLEKIICKEYYCFWPLEVNLGDWNCYGIHWTQLTSSKNQLWIREIVLCLGQSMQKCPTRHIALYGPLLRCHVRFVGELSRQGRRKREREIFCRPKRNSVSDVHTRECTSQN